jgi:electron transfer flavoprotein beta subunit
MNVIVCAKAVPYVIGSARLQDNCKDIVRSDFPFKINDMDDNALEEALLLRDKFGGKVIVITLCPLEEQERARQILLECFAKGADEAVLLTDELFSDIDSHATAKVLAQTVRTIPYDLILTGSQALDDNLGRVGPTLAGILDISYATLAVKVEATTKNLTVWTELDEGFQQIAELPLPALVTVQSGINEPRYASQMRIRMAQKKPIRVLTARDLRVSADSIRNWTKSQIDTISVPENKETEFIQGTQQQVTSTLAEIVCKIHQSNS